MKATTLQDLNDQKTRDLVRGLLDRSSKPHESAATLSRVLSAVHKTDLKTLDDILRHNVLFKHIVPLDEFPVDSPFVDGLGVSLVPSGELSLDYVALRIAENAEKICKVLQLLHALNTVIRAGEADLIAASFAEVVSYAGHSLTIARKAAFVLGYGDKDSISHKWCAELVGAYGVNGKNYGMMVTIDAIGDDFNYLDLQFRFRKFVSLERGATISQKLSHLCFAPLATTHEGVVDLVSASYEISLIDAVIALLSHIDEGVVNVQVADSVRSAWHAFATDPGTDVCQLDRNDLYRDVWAFRFAPAFIEHQSSRRLRYSFQPLYELHRGGSVSSFSREHAAHYFSNVERVSDVLPPADHREIRIGSSFDRETAGILTRSCALVWACERQPDFSGISAEDMALLMGQTFEIDRLIGTGIFQQAVRTTTDPFVKLILQTLLRAHSSATKDNFAFKDLLQRYVREYHKGDILDFMRSVKLLHKGLVSYFVNLLDETMLSQLALLMQSSEAIYDTRARLLEWYSEVSGDAAGRDKAKQLRLDRKIAAVRGAINETRLNIDSVRFRQWIELNKLSEFSDFIRQAQPNLPLLSDISDGTRRSVLLLSAHRDPTKRALVALMQSYEEFCRNSDYGIASFLGRRIRHGTLRGTLLNGLDVNERDVPPSVLVQFRSWTKEFITSIEVLANRLNFRDKNAFRNSFMSAEIDSDHKWQLCLVCLTQIHSQGQQDQGVAAAPLLIEQFCWLAFEEELSKVQKSIGEARSEWGTFRLRHGISDEAATTFERRVNLALGDHFTTVVSWFKKPPNISPVAELAHIIDVVIGEARDECATFTPDLEVVSEPGFELTGSTYYVAYDALIIAVRNAAKHGPHPGKVKIVAEVKQIGAAQILVIAVTSQLKAHDAVGAALFRIASAGSAGANDADVVEGLSGFRKLKKMERELTILSFTPEADPDSNNSLRLSFAIPLKVIVK